MGIVESIKKGFSVTKQSLPLVTLLFIFGATWNVINVFLTKNQPNPDEPSPISVILGVVFLLLSVFMQGGSLNTIHETIKKGSNAGFGPFMAGGGKNYLRLFILGILVILVAGSFILLGGISLVVPVAGVVIALLIAALAIYILILVFLAPYAITADNLGVIASIKKSVTVVRHNIRSVIGILLLLLAIGFGIGLLAGLGLGGVSLLLQGGTAAQILIAVSTSFINAFLGVVVTSAFMAFYLSKQTSN